MIRRNIKIMEIYVKIIRSFERYENVNDKIINLKGRIVTF